MSYTKRDFIDDRKHCEFHNDNNKKNCVRVLHDGKIFNSILEFGRYYRQPSPGSWGSKCLERGYDKDTLKPVIRYYDDDQARNKFNQIKQDLISKLHGEIGLIQQRINKIEELSFERN